MASEAVEGGGVVEHDSKDNGKWTMASEAVEGGGGGSRT